MKKIAVLLSILPMFVLSYSAYAFHGHHGSMQWWKNTDVISTLHISTLQLTSDQISNLNLIYTSNQASIKSIRSQLKSDRSALGQAISTNSGISSAAATVVADETALINARMNMRLALIGVLSSQQKQELVQFFQSHRKTPVATPAPSQ
jgi:Spy/CpxP family protein refolding chaperone